MNTLDLLLGVWDKAHRGEAGRWTPAKKAEFTRRLLTAATREGVHLRHGTVKHARDTIRYVERREARLVR